MASTPVLIWAGEALTNGGWLPAAPQRLDAPTTYLPPPKAICRVAVAPPNVKAKSRLSLAEQRRASVLVAFGGYDAMRLQQFASEAWRSVGENWKLFGAASLFSEAAD